MYSICSTLYLIPYYKWAVPRLLYLKKYGWVFLLSLVYFIFLTTLSNMAVSWVFAQFTQGMPSHRFFASGYVGFFMDWNMILTDAIAFLCIAFSRFSYTNEVQRHKVETDHLHLQLNLLKTQLQPHFLFNTLNSLYGMSLTGSKDTPRFILLLSQMMQYILYDCDQEEVDLKEELVFLEGYFELEQKKFPHAKIVMKVAEDIPELKIPPLLFLPLVENSFKHGKHKLENDAGVFAELSFKDGQLIFRIENEMLPAIPIALKNKRGGIGLSNIKKRLELYYPNRNQLLFTEEDHIFVAELSLKP
ncbi:sensor histidine kinase [Pedobacter sp. UC225_65]|uniref:sensor histidine kinase n=1 Tax=Pedobacter sp. UC225_65 TaxID=3350173 RepID=UPI00366DF61E